MKLSASYRRPEPGTGKPFECAICGRRLVDKRSLRQHLAAAHPSAPPRFSADAASTTGREG